MAPKSSNSKCKTPQDLHFKPGSIVEISSDDDGFRGSWYVGTIIRRASTKNPNKYLVQYEKLFNDKAGKKPLREILDLVQLRPVAPREKQRKFKFGEKVDAYHNDGWWEGSITEECEDGRFAVFFRGTREQIVFGEEDLRLHREWDNGEWQPSLERVQEEKQEENEEEDEVKEEKKKDKLKEEVEPMITKEVKPIEAMTEEKVSKGMLVEETLILKEVKPIEAMSDEKFSKGMPVEVSSDEEGFEGAWFAATIVEVVGKDKYLIEYQSLRTEDDSDFLREEVDILHIRPRPQKP
ncbi:hypothetical protein GH714_026323 [Hevea brasiliensis]|uniref:Agenet domain-containing protein n=1 Tax=Hevea brasiliensis TaxID=3981 RepID=A0A6A6M3D0_HEVBR|nr:hypothetical protein GH714_026323 [Hevea brasiliensis]